ncbi:MAG TPA: ABC transporter substrate-binding protein [Methylomirabilota bacterium]|jgi:ABC-type nitrate/sulfonate/bicarbonate transport system substrate-binding protein|nr:ABC transporter substrate-binding protein [Methylomirabilota bacterium]
MTSRWLQSVLTTTAVATLALGASLTARAQGDALRAPLPAPVKVKQGMLNVPALSPLYLLPDEAKKYNIQIETIMFQRFADERTALASGDLDIAAFGPQDISLAASQGVKSLVGVAGVGSGNDCLMIRKGEDIKAWPELLGKGIGVGAGSISWLKFTASVTENGVDYRKLKIVNIMGGGASYLKALQAKEIDIAVVWQPFCAQAITEGWGAYPTINHNNSKTVGGQLGVFAVNRAFLDKHPDAVQRIVIAYVDTLKLAQGNMGKWAEIYAQKAGLPLPVAQESIRITKLDSTLPLETIKRMTRFLAETGIVQKDISGEIAQFYTYDFLAKATGKSPTELGLNQ